MKYLLVLDDVWKEDPRNWLELNTFLTRGANGSKIVVTTRRNRVASIMRTVSAYDLAYLPHQDCSFLFFKCAFGEDEIRKLEQKENDILPALRLSYEHMPSYLKRCFAYCSIFPKDYQFDNHELVYFWMARGLVQPSNENQELEDVGFHYFKELSSRGFFQDFWEEDGDVTCKMHDLIHDLALSVTLNEFSMLISDVQVKENKCI